MFGIGFFISWVGWRSDNGDGSIQNFFGSFISNSKKWTVIGQRIDIYKILVKAISFENVII